MPFDLVSGLFGEVLLYVSSDILNAEKSKKKNGVYRFPGANKSLIPEQPTNATKPLIRYTLTHSRTNHLSTVSY